jgi:carbonic anhydrase
MNKLKKGFENFKNGYYKENEDLYKSLGSGQSPHTLMITCSDSRICPNHVTDTAPGDLFVIRNAGNLVESINKDNPSNEAITLEYAVSVLKVKNIVVCGHTHCGAMGAVLNFDDLDDNTLIKKKLAEVKHLRDTADNVPQLIVNNVKAQLENIKSYPFVQAAMERKELNLLGWVYDFENGSIENSC